MYWGCLLYTSQVEDYLSAFGAVCIEGPKWCGKTWTSSFHSKSEIYIGDPAGNFQNRQLAELSPALVLEGESPRLIDEWQEVPPLWDAVRYKVDQTPQKGQFILTGSATPNHKGILHSGAGRIARLRMRPMSLWESGDSSGKVSLEQLCHGDVYKRQAKKAQWDNEKGAIGKVQKLREELEAANAALEKAQREYDLEKAAELQMCIRDRRHGERARYSVPKA